MHPLVESVQKWQDGDQQAAEDILEHPKVKSMINRHASNFAPALRDDLKQEAIWRVLKSLKDNFVIPEITPNHQYAALLSYISRTARYGMIGYYDRQVDHTVQHQVTLKNPSFYIERLDVCSFDEDNGELDYPHNASTAEDECMLNLRREDILKAIQTLEPIEQDVILTRYFLDQEYMHLKDTYKISKTSIALKHKRALDKLYRKLYQYR